MESSVKFLLETESESSSSIESTAGIEREFSIENEIPTLNSNQIQFARDAALYVMNTRSKEEAMRVFTEGLEPVANGAMTNGDALRDSGEELVDEPRIPGRRDIDSAPF